MSDLISRKDAIDMLRNDMENNGLPYNDDYNIGINHAMCLLACVPTADLVRCGECKHWNEETHGCNRNPSVNAWLETDFCSYGERRTDES